MSKIRHRKQAGKTTCLGLLQLIHREDHLSEKNNFYKIIIRYSTGKIRSIVILDIKILKYRKFNVNNKVLQQCLATKHEYYPPKSAGGGRWREF